MGKVAVGAVHALSLGLALSLASCKDPGSNQRASRPYQSPDQYAGGTRGGGRQSQPDPEWMKEQDRLAAEAAKTGADDAKARGLAEAEALWKRAECQRDPDDAADDYKKIADDHKDSPLAEEARWRESQKRFEDRDWNAAVSALDTYTKEYPINPHLRDAERMLYEASLGVFAGARGIKGIFRSDKKGYDGLNAIVDRFPQGDYPDDALMALGEHYASKHEYPEAARSYLHVLLTYPDGPLAQQARLRLGDVYLARDQGPQYHAGYIDIDPRVAVTPMAAQVRPVKSCVEAAQTRYEEYIEHATHGHGEESCDLGYAQQQRDECRSRLAAKSRAVAAFYGRCGEGEAASTYERFAENEAVGRPWCSGLSSSPTPSVAPAATSPARPPVEPAPRPTMVPIGPTPQPPRPPTPQPTVLPPPPPQPRVSPPPPIYVPTPPPSTGAGNPTAGTPPPPPGALPPPRRTSRDGPSPSAP